MVASTVANTRREMRRTSAPRSGRAARHAWAFVYVFFTNGIPFDSPNRSEPCPRS